MLNNIINATNINKTFANAILLCIFASENTVLAVCHIIKQVANITTIMLNTNQVYDSYFCLSIFLSAFFIFFAMVSSSSLA